MFPKSLSATARSGDIAALCMQMTKSPVVVIGADIGDGIPTGTPNPDQVLAIAEAAASKRSFDGSHKYELDGVRYLPVFSDATAANLFCGAYVDLLSHVHAFRLFSVPGAALASSIADTDTLVINPQSDDEVELTREHSLALRKSLEGSKPADPAILSVTIPVPGVDEEITFPPNRE